MDPQAAHEPPADPRIGMVLQERYRILRKLGDGGMGTVYEGEHVLIKKRVAVKVLHQQFAHNPEIVARFVREAEAATSIGHPNIVEVNDMGRFPDGSAYMVLEFLQGRDWSKDISTEGPQPLGKVVHIMSQVCDALTAAHAKGIVHRDLKPENIFLLERGADPAFVKVVDFGISKVVDSANENRSLTQTGTALGTPYYMAPEQCQGRKDIDPRADIYSLGVILFQALTRRYPFDDESYPMLVLKICTEPPPPLSYYRTDLPPEIQQIVERMLAKDRTHRFGSCQEVKAALEPYRYVNAAPALAPNPPSLASRGPTVLAAVGPAKTPHGTAYLPPELNSSPAPMSAPAVEKKSPLLMLGAIAVIGVLGVGGVFAGLWVAGVFDSPAPVAENDDTPEVPPAGTQPPEAPVNVPTAVVQPPPVVQPPAPTVPQTVHIRISATPTTARMTLDGDPIPNPFEADVPRDAEQPAGAERRYHMLVVQAPNYRTHEQELSFRWDNQNVPITLERGSGTVRRQVQQQPPPIAVAPTPPVAQTPPPVQPTPTVRPTRGTAPDIFGSRPTQQPTNPRPGGDTVTGSDIFGRPN